MMYHFPDLESPQAALPLSYQCTRGHLTSAASLFDFTFCAY